MKVELTEEEWSRFLNAAALAPYSQIAPIIQKVVEQIRANSQPNDAVNTQAVNE